MARLPAKVATIRGELKWTSLTARNALGALLWGPPSWRRRGMTPFQFLSYIADPMMKALIPGPSQVAGLNLAIGLRRSGQTLDWVGRGANLPDRAERHSIAVDACCLGGRCATHETRLISGRVQYVPKPTFDITPSHYLLRVTTPATPLELNA